MNDYLETRGENLEPKEYKKISLAVAKKNKDKKSTTKRKQADFDPSEIESSK